MTTPRKKTGKSKKSRDDESGPTGTLRPDEMPADVVEFITAMDDYKRRNGRPFPNWSEVLEIVKGRGTSEATVAAARAFAAYLGKDAILVTDTPGFATSRLGVLLGLEAMRMLEQGVASAADIDKAMELGYRHPMGPLKLTDLVGLDVRLAIAEHLHRELKSAAFEPPAILREMVKAGKLGRKSGAGFYRYEQA